MLLENFQFCSKIRTHNLYLKVRKALLKATGVQAPAWLATPLGGLVSTDFESAVPTYLQRGTLSSEVMPFSGRTSCRNSLYLFYNQWDAPFGPKIPASSAKYVCVSAAYNALKICTSQYLRSHLLYIMNLGVLCLLWPVH